MVVIEGASVLGCMVFVYSERILLGVFVFFSVVRLIIWMVVSMV